MKTAWCVVGYRFLHPFEKATIISINTISSIAYENRDYAEEDPYIKWDEIQVYPIDVDENSDKPFGDLICEKLMIEITKRTEEEMERRRKKE